MKKIYCVKCNKYQKFKNPKTLYIFNKKKVLSFICDKCGSKEEESLEESL